MNKILIGFISCAVTFLLFCLLFKEQISNRILEAECTEFEFYHVRLSLCDNETRASIQAEKDSIAAVVIEYENKLLALESQNKQLKGELNSVRQNSRLNNSKITNLIARDIPIRDVIQKGNIYKLER